MNHYPSLHGYQRTFGAGDAVAGVHAGPEAGEDEQRHGVHAKHNERPRPAFVAFDIDQPIAAAEHQQSESGRRQHVRTRPQSLVHREIAVPDQAESEERGAEEEDAGDLVQRVRTACVSGRNRR